jgi:hypothetical protein
MTEDKIVQAAATVIKFCGEEQPLAEYLRMILIALLEEGEGFSGKRPLGDSGWQWDVYKALVAAKLIDGEIDKDGDLMDFDAKQADELVLAVIKRLVIKREYNPEEPLHRMGL